MSNQIPTHFVPAFRSGIQLLQQQKMSRLRPCVREEGGEKGKQWFFDQIGASAMNEVTERHGDTKYNNTPHARRMVVQRSFDWADLIDKEDKIRTLNDPQSDYARAANAAANRQVDDLLIEAAFATAATGETGTGSAAFPTSTHQVVEGGFGLTVDKLRDANRILDEYENEEGEERYVACSAKQISDLLGETKVGSADYNNVKALVDGKVDTFMGFKFKRSQRLLAVGDDRRCIAWSKNSLLLAVAADVTVTIDRMPGKRNAVQVYLGMTMGATRMDEVGVVEILCDE